MTPLLVLLLIISALKLKVNYCLLDESDVGIDSVQAYNIKTLKTALPSGWRYFCESEVDEAVMSFYPGASASDGTVSVLSHSNEAKTFPIKSLRNLKIHLSIDKKIVIFVSAFVSGSLFDIRGNLEIFQKTRSDLNVMIIDFARDIAHLYTSIKHNIYIEGYFVSKLIEQLIAWNFKLENIILTGHSVGANIASLGALLYQEDRTEKLPLLIAIDPATMCDKSDVHLNSTIAEKVIVIHGENDVFSVKEAVGTVDIYLNGDSLRHQPGCSSNLCSHMYPFLVFMEAVIDNVEVKAVKCEDWMSFKRGKCDFGNVVQIGLEYGECESGRYFCSTLGMDLMSRGRE